MYRLCISSQYAFQLILIKGHQMATAKTTPTQQETTVQQETTPTLTPEKVSEVLVNTLWNKTFPNGKLIISDESSARTDNFHVVKGLVGSSGARVSDILSDDQIWEVLNGIRGARVAHRVGRLDF